MLPIVFALRDSNSRSAHNYKRNEKSDNPKRPAGMELDIFVLMQSSNFNYWTCVRVDGSKRCNYLSLKVL
jgi:hypothetical protein